MDLSKTMSDIFKQNQPGVNQFYTDMMKNGLGQPLMNQLTDFKGGTTAQAYAPARAQLAQRLSRMSGLPSGFATQAGTDLDANQARAFDSNMIQNLLMNQQAKQQGAQGLNPLAFGSQAQQGYSGVMQMPQQPSMLGSVLGGALGGLAGGI